MKTVNIGLAGAGFMGVTHLKAYHKIPGARLAALCDISRIPASGDLSSISGNVGDGKPLKIDLSQIKGFKNSEDMLADAEIDLIDLCVPTPLHHGLSIAALRAGKHVICEKPLARTSALCREIVETAQASKGYFMPAMVMRFWPEWAWLKKTIDEGTFGNVLAARFRRVSPPPGWGRANYFKGEISGGALLDLHIHDTDFVQYCFGRPTSVFSTGTSRYSGAIDHVLTSYQYFNGVPIMAEGSWLMSDSYGFKMEFTVNFENATVDFDLARGADALKVHEPGQKSRTIQCGADDGYVMELSHMIESIQNGVAPSIVTAADGLSAVEICEAEERSVKTGAVVEL